MGNVTILYCTANVENEIFERNIIKDMLEKHGDLPIVSVSHKPMDLGKNICVGTHEPCYANRARQVQIGLREVNTEYVLIAEADFWYPKEYFTWSPRGADYYNFQGVFVVYTGGLLAGKAVFKEFSDGAQLIKRDFFLDKLDRNFRGRKKWFNRADKVRLPHAMKPNLNNIWTSDTPAVTFKTDANVNRTTVYLRWVPPMEEISGIGSVRDFTERMFKE